jgi:hypothetical protein
MANYNSHILAHTFGLSLLTDATDWWIGLYLQGGDPFADLWSCEAAVSRQSLVGNLKENPNDTSSLVNIYDIEWLAVPQASYQGWFIVNGENEYDVGWIGAFTSIQMAYDGDNIVFPSETLYIGLSTTYVVVSDGGGGGGMPG